jgi:hypothetical protein
MATNLRLRPELETALREEAARTGRSQQELIREALERFLGLGLPTRRPAGHSLDELIAAGVVKHPREPFRRAPRLLPLPEGVTTMDLLDREDRF